MDIDERGDLAIDHEVKTFVLSLVSALGGSSAADDGRYVLGDDALAVLKDIKRWLRLYDDKTNRLDVARLLAEANFVKGDLLEILANWPEDAPEGSFRSKIALLLDLLTQLTWPVDKEEQFTSLNHFVHKPRLHAAQLSYKHAILHHDSAKILGKIARVSLPAMAQERLERSQTEENVIKVVLYLFRNVTMISAPEGVAKDEDDAEIARSATVDAFHHQDIFDLLLTIGSGIGDEFCEHDVELLDVLFHLLKGIDVDRLFMERDELVSSNTHELRNLIGKEKGMLAGYARFAPSRHNRFGTKTWMKRDDGKFASIFGQTAAVNGQVAFGEIDKSKKWKRPRRSAPKAAPDDVLTEFSLSVLLTASARRHLRRFIEQFLDSSFNPLFLAVRRSIEREAPRVLAYHLRQFFFLISFFLRAECARRQKQAVDRSQRSIPQGEVETFALVAGVLNQETFVLLNRCMQKAQDDKNWKDLNACMKCFTQILQTVQEMSESPVEEDQEISENTLNRIFYEQTTHDRIIALLRTYKDQGFSYLDSCTELAHVFLRMLERYSKVNLDMQVRSMKKARKKIQRKEAMQAEDAAAEDREAESTDLAQAQRTSTERRFDFNRFAAKFVTQPTIETFVAFTRYFRDLSTDQLKRAHRFFHRAAFKMDLSVYLFRVDIILLFHKLIKGPEGMDIDDPSYKDWEELVRQVFRKLVRRMQERPALATELLFSKIPSTHFYLEHGFDRELPKPTPKAPAELEVKPGMEKDDQVGVVVSVLINQSKSDMLAWVKEVLSSAASERKSWEEAHHAIQSVEGDNARQQANSSENPESHDYTQPSASSRTKPNPIQPSTQTQSQPDTDHRAPSILIRPSNADLRTATNRDKHLRLLFNLLSFQNLNDASLDANNSEANWMIPSSLSSSHLTHSHEFISRTEFSPPTYDDGKGPEDFLRRKPIDAALAAQEERKRATRERRAKRSRSSGHDSASSLDSGSESDRSRDGNEGEEGSSSVDEDLFAPGGPTPRAPDHPCRKKTRARRRRRRDADEHLEPRGLEEKRAAKRKLERERAQKVKSSLFVSRSDDESDEDRDRQFFEREARIRKGVGGSIAEVLGLQGSADRKGSGKGKKRKADDAGEGEGGGDFAAESSENDHTGETRGKRRKHGGRAASRPDRGSSATPSLSRVASAASSPDAGTRRRIRHGPFVDSPSPWGSRSPTPAFPASEVDTEHAGDTTPPSSQRPSSGHGAACVSESADRKGRTRERGEDGDVEMADGAVEGESDKENVRIGGEEVERAGRGGGIKRRRGVLVVESDDDE